MFVICVIAASMTLFKTAIYPMHTFSPTATNRDFELFGRLSHSGLSTHLTK